MLHIIDDYNAQANNYGYTVLRRTGKKDKDGQDIFITLGYVGSLQEVLALVLKDSVQRKVSGIDVIELSDTLKYVRTQANRIVKAMEGIGV
ncbi:MAG TPA: hypothetical protein IAA00_02320 [Candidatus Blautia ornithocaccae]|nr:hypothetical protein [Candidatus Blautia ornithocaccae]